MKQDMPQSFIDADLEAWREQKHKPVPQFHHCRICGKDLECDEPFLFVQGECHCESLDWGEDDGCKHEI